MSYLYFKLLICVCFILQGLLVINMNKNEVQKNWYVDNLYMHRSNKNLFYLGFDKFQQLFYGKHNSLWWKRHNCSSAMDIIDIWFFSWLQYKWWIKKSYQKAVIDR
jgi:hypothetical protein